MKKIAIFAATTFLAVMAAVIIPIVSYAKANEVPITEENLTQLKGKWEGYRRGLSGWGQSPTDFEIENDVLPLKGRMINYQSPSGGDSVSLFEDGAIKKGKLHFKLLGKYGEVLREVTLTLYVSGKKMELRGAGEAKEGKIGAQPFLEYFFIKK
jgi:hypothetical protein